MEKNIKTMNEIEVLIAALKVGFVKFSYYKVDGTLRTAIGTKCFDYINEMGVAPKSEDKREKNPNLCVYYDMVRCAWRCFRKDLFNHIEYENMSAEEACAYAMGVAVKDEECDVERVINLFTSFVGVTSVAKITDYVCDHKESEVEDIAEGCMEEVFHIVPTNVEVVAAPSVAIPTTQMSNDRRAELKAELLRLKAREIEILSELL